MRRTSMVSLTLLLFGLPFLETAVFSTRLGVFKGLSVFPVVAISICLIAARPLATKLTLIGAAWRDIVLLQPFAPTLFGTGLSLVVFVLLRRTLTNRSIASDGLTVSLAYGGYLFGSAAAFWVARHLGIVAETQEFFASHQAIIILILVLLLTMVWRYRQPMLPGRSSRLLP